MAQPLLEVRGLSRRFGGLQAVADLSFSVDPGTIKALYAAREAVALLEEGSRTGNLTIPAREKSWFDRIRSELDALPDREQTLIADVQASLGSLYDPASYGLPA